MKITFFSNFLNHHQEHFCNEMSKLLGPGNFYFVAKKETPMQHIVLGYESLNNIYDYVIRSYESNDSKELARRLYLDSDVVIGGDWDWYPDRLIDNKLILNYSERIFKKPFEFLNPIKGYVILKTHTINRKKNLYLLSASAYAASDFRKYFAYQGKAFKWGYFVECKEHDIVNLINRKRNKSEIEIVWAGRLIKWKHPEVALMAIKHLRREGYRVKLKIIGSGPLDSLLQRKIKIDHLHEYVELTGSMNHNEVRQAMEEASIFLLTSDRQEGWGAVLGEAMNSGCAVIASKKTGSAPYLINHGINGLLYRGEDCREIVRNLKWLLNNPDQIYILGANAYHTMETWSPKVAAERLVDISQSILSGQSDVMSRYKYGPCSDACIL